MTGALRWPAVVCWAIAVAALSQAPNGWGRTHAGATTFLGTLAPWPEDATYHLSFVEQARGGAWLFEDKYNGNRVRTRLVFNLYFSSVGRSARGLGLSTPDAGLLAKGVVAIGLLLSAYLFAGRYLETRRERQLFLLLAPFGSGLGWLSAWGLAPRFDSIDQWAVEASTFWSLADDLIAPVTTALLLCAFALLERALERPSRPRALACGGAALVLGAVHPHDLLVTFLLVSLALVALRSLAPRRLMPEPGGVAPTVRSQWWTLLWIGACAAPILLWNSYVLSREPLFWSYVTLDDTLSPRAVALGLGWPLLLGLLGACRALRRDPARLLLPVLWPTLALVLLYVPVPPCRQFFLLHGVQLVVCMLATGPLARVFETVASRPRAGGRAAAWVALAALLSPACLTNAVHWHGWVRLLQERAPDRFVAPPVAAGMRWLRENAPPESALLAGEALSRLAPALAGVRVVAAQEQQTVDYPRWRALVEGFFRGTGDGPGDRAFLRDNGIRFVAVGPEERRLGGAELEARLEDRLPLTRAAVFQDLVIYRVEDVRRIDPFPR